MSETGNPQQTEQNKDKNDFDAAIAAINKNLTEKMESKLSAIESKIDNIPLKNSTDPIDTNGDEDDDSYVTKKDLKSLAKSILDSAKKTTEEVADRTFDIKASRNMKDAEVVSDFPLLNRKDPEFNQSFYDEVNTEVGRRVKGGHNANDPNLVYDAAAVVEKQWVKSGKYVPKSTAARINQSQNNRGDSFSITGTSNHSDTPTEYQNKLAERFGLTKEKLAQHMKNTR